MDASNSEQELVRAVQAGDEAAWREVIARYESRLLSFARRATPSQADAEDAVQETFFGLLGSLASYDPQRSLETYLFAILRNKLRDQYRRVERDRRSGSDLVDAVELDATPVRREDTPSRQLAAQEQADRQRDALVTAMRNWVHEACAAGRFDEVILMEMLVLLGMRNKDAAADLQMTETAVAGMKFRVLERWRKSALADCPNDPDMPGLVQESSLPEIWRAEGISCPKRTTLGRWLLGVLEPDWERFVQFHVEIADCLKCRANLDDLQREESGKTDARFQERCFASSVGLLRRRQ